VFVILILFIFGWGGVVIVMSCFGSTTVYKKGWWSDGWKWDLGLWEVCGRWMRMDQVEGIKNRGYWNWWTRILFGFFGKERWGRYSVFHLFAHGVVRLELSVGDEWDTLLMLGLDQISSLDLCLCTSFTFHPSNYEIWTLLRLNMFRYWTCVSMLNCIIS
jgi:hypothetical protein